MESMGPNLDGTPPGLSWPLIVRPFFSSGALFGVTTRRTFPAILLLVLFSVIVGIYHGWALADPRIPEIELPLTPFELTAPVLGLLLVFRTNSAYERFSEGSAAAWEVTGPLLPVHVHCTSGPGRCLS